MEMILHFFSRVCLQIPDGPSAEVQEILEEFLMKWRYVDGKYYTVASMEEFSNQISLGVDKYLEIVELYVITFLGRILGNLDLAISWVEKFPLPEEKRQVNNNLSCFILLKWWSHVIFFLLSPTLFQFFLCRASNWSNCVVFLV